MSDLPLTVAEWPRNSRETLRIRLDRFNDRDTIDVRCWYGAPDDLKPTRTGITLGVAHLQALAAAVADALAEARRRGLILVDEAAP